MSRSRSRQRGCTKDNRWRENNTQIQPYAREKSGSRDRFFWFNGKEYTSYSEMVQAKGNGIEECY